MKFIVLLMLFLIAPGLVFAGPPLSTPKAVEFVQLAPEQPGGVAGPAERLRDLAGAATLYAACCKTCHTGKACGDSCISREKSCHKGPGCACDG